MRDAQVTPLLNSQPRHFATSREGQVLWLHGDAMLWQGYAPANPAVTDLSYLTLRSPSHSHRRSLMASRILTIGRRYAVSRGSGDLRIQLRRGEIVLRVEVDDSNDSLPQWHIAQGTV